MAREYTAAQRAAIEARNAELLVSAAAGSGKTAVLVERIYSMLKDDRMRIDRMLIVTFTRAAAAEMRERLEARIAEGAEDDAWLRDQSSRVESAQIGTLHGFCRKLTREFFQEADIDPQAAQCEDAQRANLLLAAREEALDWGYDQARADAELSALTVKFSENELSEMLDRLYSFLLSLPAPLEWLDACAAHRYTEDDLRAGPLVEAILPDCRMLLAGASEACAESEALAVLGACPGKYVDCIRADRAMLDALTAACGDGLTALSAALRASAFVKLPGLRNLSPEEAAVRDRYKAVREREKKQLEELGKLLPADPAQAIADMERMQPALRGLAKLARALHERFQEKKSERDLIDFGDLEHMALKILRNDALRGQISARYDAIFVDEYQDTSALQQAILDALRDVSRETSGAECSFNVPRETSPSFFCVGDVKQSIYRFRQADPTLFLQKLRDFSEAPDAPRRRISLNRNFRSRETVLDAVNRVFERVMRPDVTELDYDAEARLYPGLPSRGDPPVTLHVFAQPGARAADRPRLEAREIAREIQRRVGEPTIDREGREGREGPPLRYRDFAVLMPVARGVSEVVERALSEAGVPVYCEDGKAGMESPEIAQTLEHLRLLDNLENDLALLAALRGPVYAFTEPELAAVRLARPEREASFADALRAAAGQDGPLGERCRDTLRRLENERFWMRSLPLDEYLWDWLARSGLYGFYGAQPGGRLRQANLRMLCQKASDCVRSRGGDLRAFLETVTASAGVSDGGSPTVLSQWEDVVRVMTIHKSKGLEFPVVFVMGLGDRLHKAASAGTISLHPRLGVALRYVNEEARTMRPTLLAGAIALRARAEEKAERARVLYVAMTRARDELQLLGGPCPLPAEGEGFPQASSYAVWQAKSMLEWLSLCLQSGDDMRVCGANGVSDSAPWKKATEATLCTVPTTFPQGNHPWRAFFHIDENDPELQSARTRAEQRRPLEEAELREARISAIWKRAMTTEALPPPLSARVPAYIDRALPGEAAAPDPIAPPLRFTHEPFKVGVTALCRARSEAAGALEPGLAAVSSPEPDPDAEDSREPPELKRLPLPLTKPRLLGDLPRLPAFLRPEPEQTGVLRGVATHKALSMLPLAPLRGLSGAALREAIDRALDALALARRVTAQERERIDARTLAGFFESEEGRGALAADTVRREWSFNARVEGSRTIAQGVIDLCYLRDGAWELIDYKTDRVRDPEELWGLYGPQIELYRRALGECTPYPVRRAMLFSLALGAGSSR